MERDARQQTGGRAVSSGDDGTPRRLREIFERSCDRTPSAVALQCGDRLLTYDELDKRANQLAHLLIERGVETGARVAIMVERSVETYVALLGALKAGAAFVPIDPAVPDERVAYIAGDADVDMIVTTRASADRLAALHRPWLAVDAEAEHVGAQPVWRPALDTAGDPACYVLYTSGSTGRPKGVEVAESSICNFLSVVPDVYDVRPTDRVYQGMTIAFDFSIEEIWPTWTVGATVVAGPTDTRRLGEDLADFLHDQSITVLYCVPTLLATIPRELPALRSILVGGEACPQELVERFARPGRRILNTYGPTEATVTATWCELLPGRPVTIGVPLPTYSVVLLDDRRLQVPDGEVGEICIGGPGVARGYVGRPDLTADKFIDHVHAPAGGKLYRTGDLGKMTPDGQIEYLGRADAEVKIRGRRVDLGEIESILLEDDALAGAVVSLATVGAADELAAYLTIRSGAANRDDDPDNERLCTRLYEQLRERVPDYMVPTFVDVLEVLPTQTSGKVDRKRLPAPSGRRLRIAHGPVVAAETATEARLVRIWADVAHLDPATVSVEADFFGELGGHSMLAARLVSALRTERGFAHVGLRDIYLRPTIREFACVVDDTAADNDRGTTTAGDAASGMEPGGHRPAPLRHGRAAVARTGTAQAVFVLTVLLLTTVPVSVVYSRHHGQPSWSMLGELLIATIPTYLGVRWVLPLALARPLAAGITAGVYPLWGATYLRLWMIDHLLMLSPLPVLSGSPLLPVFLRLMGARIGRGCDLGTSVLSFPALLRVGDGASIGYHADLRAWRVEAGRVHVAPIEVGPGAFVGANAVLEPGACLGAGAVLAEQSVLTRGQRVEPGEWWAGSPSRRETSAYDAVIDEMMTASQPPRWSARLIVAVCAGLVGIEATAIATVIPALLLVWLVLLKLGMMAALVATIPSGTVYVLTVCALVAGGRRLLLPRLPTGIHPVASGLGVRKWLADKLFDMSLTYTNSLYGTLYTVGWLRLLGADVGRGVEVSTAAHIEPALLTIRDESFVADMASIGGTRVCHRQMALAPTIVGTRSFIGNASCVPADSETGPGSLIGVMTVPPEDGVPAGSSWLGSPAMYLPARQDSGTYDDAETYRPSRRRIAHRLWIEYFRVTLPATIIGVSLYMYLLGLSQVARTSTMLATIAVGPLLALLTGYAVILYVAAVKRNLIGTYVPRVEPLWSKFVRRSEFVTGLYEATAVPVLLAQLTGTPFMAHALRRFGASIGNSCYVATTYLTEFDLVHLGDHSSIGAEVSLQTHLFEDRVMKMSAVTVAEGATVGTRSIVLYDAVVDTDADMASLSLLMKGEHLPAQSNWHGIPAQVVA